jgi:alcohol dehydrogenase YqhD (iron-dependent ADH family)
MVVLVGVARGEAAMVGVTGAEGPGVEPNPLVNGIAVAVAVAKEAGIDGLVGVGSRRVYGCGVAIGPAGRIPKRILAVPPTRVMFPMLSKAVTFT